MKPSTIGITLALCLSFGCSFTARDTAAYRQATRDLLATKNGDIKTCYDNALAGGEKHRGTVVVRFKVEKKSGKIQDASVDKAHTDAPEPLQACVLSAISGLALAEPDRRDADATFTWSFRSV